MSSIDSGNVFQIAAAANVYSQIGNTASLNIDPIMTEMAMAQVRNTLGTDFQWTYDRDNTSLGFSSLIGIYLRGHNNRLTNLYTMKDIASSR